MIILITLVVAVVLAFFLWFIFRKVSVTGRQKKILFTVATIFSVAAFLLLNKTIHEFYDFVDLLNWDSVPGEIVSAEVVGIKTREPEIGYKYMVEGQTYEGKSNLGTPLFASAKSQDMTARKIVSQFKTGDSLRVYYNPQDAAVSLLKITPHWNTYMQYGFGVILLTLALLLFLLPFINKRA